MSDADAYTIETKGLDQLLKALKAKPPQCCVGVLDDQTRSLKPGQKSGATNAEVGAAHEFGTSSLPQRSFLRMPLSDYLGKEMKSEGAFTKDEMALVIKQGSVIPWLKKIGKMGERIVQDAFNSGGFGKWPKWKDKGYTNNANMLLVDTTSLRDSISSEVEGG